MELEAFERGEMRLIIEEVEEYIIFNILKRHIIQETGILHRGQIDKDIYECDPHVFTLFFRQYNFEDILKSNDINQEEYISNEGKRTLLKSFFQNMKYVSLLIGVLNDIIRIEFDYDIQVKIENKELENRFKDKVPKEIN